MEKGVRGLQLTSLVFDDSSAAFNIPEGCKIHELFSEGNTLLCQPSLSAKEGNGAVERQDGT